MNERHASINEVQDEYHPQHPSHPISSAWLRNPFPGVLLRSSQARCASVSLHEHYKPVLFLQQSLLPRRLFGFPFRTGQEFRILVEDCFSLKLWHSDCEDSIIIIINNGVAMSVSVKIIQFLCIFIFFFYKLQSQGESGTLST